MLCDFFVFYYFKIFIGGLLYMDGMLGCFPWVFWLHPLALSLGQSATARCVLWLLWLVIQLLEAAGGFAVCIPTRDGGPIPKKMSHLHQHAPPGAMRSVVLISLGLGHISLSPLCVGDEDVGSFLSWLCPILKGLWIRGKDPVFNSTCGIDNWVFKTQTEHTVGTQ